MVVLSDACVAILAQHWAAAALSAPDTASLHAVFCCTPAAGIKAEAMWGCGHLIGYLDELFPLLCFCPFFIHVAWVIVSV